MRLEPTLLRRRGNIKVDIERDDDDDVNADANDDGDDFEKKCKDSMDSIKNAPTDSQKTRHHTPPLSYLKEDRNPAQL